MFLVAVGFWNFVGAGVFGFLINLPIVSYYQIGTALTANHAHGAMMGVYGMMGVGLSLFALRYIIPANRWPDRLAKLSFWSLNIGLAWMVFVTLLPLGVLQLWHSVNDGYFEARELGYITRPGNAFLEWMRMPGDVIFLVPGILPFLWITFLGIRYGIRATATVMEPETLFVEEHAEAREDRTGELLPNSRYASDRRTDVLVEDPDGEGRT
jgi:nitric oxide reductase subunit B